MKSLTIWTNYRMDEQELKWFAQRIAPHRLCYAPGKGDPTLLASADIAFGQPDVEPILTSDTLRWVAISSAGYTKYDREDLRKSLRARGAIMTNSSSVFAEACAQHVLAWMLAGSRALPAAIQNQQGPRNWPCDALRSRSRLIRGSRVLLVGFGSIARSLTAMLAPFNVEIIGFRRNPKGDEPVRVVPIGEIDPHLPQADHIVNILPQSDSTLGFFDAARFARMLRTATFYNIGRGRTVDQDSLQSALTSGAIAAAYLDVTHPEPLPPEHPLWTVPNCVITPHTGGGYGNEREVQIHHFFENLKRFESAQVLRDRVL